MNILWKVHWSICFSSIRFKVGCKVEIEIKKYQLFSMAPSPLNGMVGSNHSDRWFFLWFCGLATILVTIFFVWLSTTSLE